MSSDLPAHVSPALRAARSASSQPSLSSWDIERANAASLPSIVSPAISPPLTPGSDAENGTSHASKLRYSHQTPQRAAADTAHPTNSVTKPRAELVQVLPEVQCIVRARIPTTTGTEMYLHLYENNVDSKEHLAIVFGSTIRSRSLDAEQPGETEQDRMIRGAYVGRLYPGRTSSRTTAVSNSTDGKASPLLRSIHQRKLGSARRDSVSAEPLPEAVHPLHPETASSHSPSGTHEEESNTVDGDGPVSPDAPLVRIHSECYTGETVWSARCDCGEQLDEAARLMAEVASSSEPDASQGGVIVYLRQEGRGIGLSEKLKAYNLQDLGNNTYEANLLLRHPADARSYGLATAILVDLGLGGDTGIRLLTNNPDKIRAVEGPGREVKVKERVPMVPLAWKTDGKEGVKGKEVEGYLRTKIEQFGHLLSEPH